MNDEVKVGSRVYWWNNSNLKGKIEGIYLSDYPFHVRWDNEKDDWYEAWQLKLIKEEEV